MQSTLYSFQILMKHQFSQQICEKSLNINFHENPYRGSRIIPCGWTDGHDKSNSRFLQFCERA